MFVTTPPFFQYLAPLGAKYLQKKAEKMTKIDVFLFFFCVLHSAVVSKLLAIANVVSKHLSELEDLIPASCSSECDNMTF